MIVKLYDIEEHLAVKGSVDASRLLRPEDKEIGFLSPIEYDLTLTKVGDNVWVRGPVRANLSLPCARCLEAFSFLVETEMDIELQPKVTGPTAAEVELKTEEMDLYYFEGDEIDLDPYVFEEVMLNIPVKPLCSEACKGMCPICGTNLNIEECRCEKIGTTLLGERLKLFLNKQ